MDDEALAKAVHGRPAAIEGSDEGLQARDEKPAAPVASGRDAPDGADIAIGALSNRDRAYLQDFIQFGFMGHAVAAEAYRRAYEQAEAAAACVRSQLERIGPADAAAMAQELNDGARIQSIVVARLVSEYAAAIEDLAGMMVAIRDRGEGVMRTYLTSGVSQTGDVLAAIDRGEELGAVLGLPDPDSLPGDVSAELRTDLEHAFGDFAGSLRQIAAAARDEGEREAATTAGAGTNDRIAVVIDVGEPVRRRPRGLLFQAHNRVKHRFMVVERIESLGDLPAEPIRYATAPRDPVFVATQVSNITQVCLATAELAALLLALDARDRAVADRRRP